MGVTHATEKYKKPKKLYLDGLEPNTYQVEKAVTPRNLKTQDSDLINKQFNKTPRQFDFQDRQTIGDWKSKSNFKMQKSHPNIQFSSIKDEQLKEAFPDNFLCNDNNNIDYNYTK